MKLLAKFKRRWAQYKGGETYLNYLRRQGIRIGKNCTIGPARTIEIDLTRPCLVEIGDNVRMLKGFTLLTHDFVTAAFITRYGEFLPSSGKVKIGNNVYFGRNCTVLKGVTIGDNVIVGYGSIVTKDIPSNSVCVGSPAKVICTFDEYFEKRKLQCVTEAQEYAREIVNVYGRKPGPADFREEFGLFCSGNEIDKYPEIPIKFQLTRNGGCYDRWCVEHTALFDDFESFLNSAGL